MKESNKTIQERQKKEKEALLEILKEMPIVRVACKRAGISRATAYRWKNEDKHFLQQYQEAMQIGMDAINEMSDSQLITLIGEKDFPAIRWWQQHNHERYGAKLKSNPYLEGMESSDPDSPRLKRIREITQRYENELREEIIKEINEES